MGVRNGRQRLSVDRADESVMCLPDETMRSFFHSPANPFAEQLHTERATFATCSRLFDRT